MALSFEAYSRLEARVNANLQVARQDPQGYERRVARWLWLGEKLCALAGFLRMTNQVHLNAKFPKGCEGEAARAQSALVDAEPKHSPSAQDRAQDGSACSEKSELTRCDAPALFAMIDELCARAEITVPISVFLVPGLSVSIDVGYHEAIKTDETISGHREWLRISREQRRARWPRASRRWAKLSLGAAVLKTVDVNELRAILAHELSHVAGRQSQLSHRCKLLDRHLDEIGLPVKTSVSPTCLAQLPPAQHAEITGRPFWLASLVAAGICRLKCALWVRVLPVFRNAEFEADCFGANLVGTKVFAAALVRISVTDKRHNCYPPSLINELDAKGIGCKTDPLDERVLKYLLAKRSDAGTIHPCLSERLEWINAAAVLPPPVRVPAQILLGNTPA